MSPSKLGGHSAQSAASTEVRGERGIAMITTLLVLMLMSALLVGFTAVVMSDQRFRFIDRDRGQSFYAANGGVEKLTADLGNLFFTTLAPTSTQITALTANMPTIPGVSFVATNAPTSLPASSLSTYYCGPSPKTPKLVGGTGSPLKYGYTIMFCTDATGNPVPTSVSPVKSGPYEGLIAAQTPFQIDVTARTASGGETHLIRTMEAVAIPVFQFGMFSDVDLSFFAGPSFNFGGRVHTNGNLFLSQGPAATLTLSDKVTAFKEIIRQRLQNGVSIDTPSTHDGTVSVKTSPTTSRNLARTEGSLVDGLGSAQNEPTWQTIAGNYNNWLRSGRTGAKELKLPLITVGGTNPDLIRRPPAGEDAANPILFSERLFSKASLRILLSDTAADITALPTVTGTAPVQLDGDWTTTPPNNGAAYGPVNTLHPPIARTPGPLATTVAGSVCVVGPPANCTAINVANTASFRPNLKLNLTAVTCTGKDATHFLGCTAGMPATAAGVSVTAGPGLSVATTAVTTAGSVQITVGSTASFNPAPFWIGDEIASCTGYTATSFTGCMGISAAPAVNAVVTSYGLSSAGTGTIGGFIKIELQDTNKAWRDVTMEILNYGIGGKNLDGDICALDPTPNAILRIQRLRDNGGAAGGGCNYNTDTTGGKDSSNWWPNVLFDTREALQRDAAPAGANLVLGGVMYYIALDATNLSMWFKGTAPFNAGSGVNAIIDNTGFTVYFSDRRNNRNASNLETGDYGFEDFVNPTSATGAPNATLDVGEDVNGNKILDTYGAIPNYNGVSGALPPGALTPLIGTASPATSLEPGQAKVNRSILFRHALKIINGADIAALGVNGLTIVAENPVYLQGDWNANGPVLAKFGTAPLFNDPHAATAIIADAVTLLSNAWTDEISFSQPYALANRLRSAQTWYRVAIIGGKGMAFAQPTGTATDFGTDGGAHNFLRYLEAEGPTGLEAVNYRGSIATFFYNRQAVGTYKCCNTVYSAPKRFYDFDSDFLDPAKLPPNTPVFRDLNAVGFSQELRPGR